MPKRKRYKRILPPEKRKSWEEVNHMNTRSNRQLALGHAILHAWSKDPARTNWTKEAIIKEHERLVKIMKERGFEHNTPLRFSEKWKRI